MGTLKPGAVSGRRTDVSREVGGLSDSGCRGTLTLGGERPRNDVVAHGDKHSSKGASGTPEGVLVRSTNACELKIDAGKGTPRGNQK